MYVFIKKEALILIHVSFYYIYYIHMYMCSTRYMHYCTAAVHMTCTCATRSTRVPGTCSLLQYLFHLLSSKKIFFSIVPPQQLYNSGIGFFGNIFYLRFFEFFKCVSQGRNISFL